MYQLKLYVSYFFCDKENKVNIQIAEYEMTNAMASCACVIKYLQLLEDEVNFGKYTLRHHDLSQYMRLDGSALAALNLMPAPNEAANRPSSLYGLLNKCKTAQGSRLFTQWLKQPLLSLEEISKKADRYISNRNFINFLDK